MHFFLVLALATIVASAPQGDPTTTTAAPVQILKQINNINVDGSYTYGFEAEDGTFRVETRDKHGNVKGKFGYLDETGEIKVVEYRAGNGTGFSADGKHLPVAPVPAVVPAVPATVQFQPAPALPVTQVRNVFQPAPAAVPVGNFNDEFGTDEDFQSVDADEDGQPDAPRSRVPVVVGLPAPVPVASAVPAPVPLAAAVPASTQRLQQPAVLPQQAFPQIQGFPINFFQQQVQANPVPSVQSSPVVQQVGNARFVNFQPAQPQFQPVQPQFQPFPAFNPGFFQPVPQGQQ